MHEVTGLEQTTKTPVTHPIEPSRTLLESKISGPSVILQEIASYNVLKLSHLHHTIMNLLNIYLEEAWWLRHTRCRGWILHSS